MLVCAFGCLRCLLGASLVCLLACLLAHCLACLLACLPTCSYFRVCLFVSQVDCLFVSLIVCLFVCLLFVGVFVVCSFMFVLCLCVFVVRLFVSLVVHVGCALLVMKFWLASCSFVSFVVVFVCLFV